MTDSSIINYIKKKNETGLEMLIDIYGALITSIVRKHLYNLPNVQEECIDDILIAIWNNISSFNKEKNSFKNWIGAISKYNAINYKKKYVKELMQEDIDLYSFEANDNVENNILKNELKEEVTNLLSNLKDDDKEIFIKHYLEEKDIYSIVDEMNLKASVIYNRLSRGRKKLRSRTETTS